VANFQLGDTQKVAYALTELDAQGNTALPQQGDIIQIVPSDLASATVVADAVPAAGSVASGFIVAGKKAQVGVAIVATVTHPDGTSLSVTDFIDVVGGTASTLSLSLGAPVAQ
jgi:hypothetical protein